MPRKIQSDPVQLPLMQMTKSEYEHAASRFSKLKIQHRDVKQDKKNANHKFNQDLKDLEGEMQGLAESIIAYEKARP